MKGHGKTAYGDRRHDVGGVPQTWDPRICLPGRQERTTFRVQESMHREPRSREGAGRDRGKIYFVRFPHPQFTDQHLRLEQRQVLGLVSS